MLMKTTLPVATVTSPTNLATYGVKSKYAKNDIRNVLSSEGANVVI